MWVLVWVIWYLSCCLNSYLSLYSVASGIFQIIRRNLQICWCSHAFRNGNFMSTLTWCYLRGGEIIKKILGNKTIFEGLSHLHWIRPPKPSCPSVKVCWFQEPSLKHKWDDGTTSILTNGCFFAFWPLNLLSTFLSNFWYWCYSHMSFMVIHLWWFKSSLITVFSVNIVLPDIISM